MPSVIIVIKSDTSSRAVENEIVCQQAGRHGFLSNISCLNIIFLNRLNGSLTLHVRLDHASISLKLYPNAFPAGVSASLM